MRTKKMLGWLASALLLQLEGCGSTQKPPPETAASGAMPVMHSPFVPRVWRQLITEEANAIVKIDFQGVAALPEGAKVKQAVASMSAHLDPVAGNLVRALSEKSKRVLYVEEGPRFFLFTEGPDSEADLLSILRAVSLPGSDEHTEVRHEFHHVFVGELHAAEVEMLPRVWLISNHEILIEDASLRLNAGPGSMSRTALVTLSDALAFDASIFVVTLEVTPEFKQKLTKDLEPEEQGLQNDLHVYGMSLGHRDAIHFSFGGEMLDAAAANKWAGQLQARLSQAKNNLLFMSMGLTSMLTSVSVRSEGQRVMMEISRTPQEFESLVKTAAGFMQVGTSVGP